MTTTSDDHGPRLAAVVYQASTDVDGVLRQAISLLRQRGISVGGIVQRVGARRTACQRTLLVEDLLTGSLLRISQDLGPGAQSCILDPTALAAASEWLRRAMGSRVDVVVGNRFGEQEANGCGLRSEIAEAAAAGFVVLTAVNARYLDALIEFAGEYAAVFEPDARAVSDWVMAAVAARSSSPIGVA